MKWFKHDTDANSDAKLKKVRIKYGMTGYGLYWYCLEIIAGDVDVNNITFELEHDAEIIAHDTGINVQLVNEMMAFMIDLGLFEQSTGRVTCLKMATRIDQSMTSNPHMRKIINDFKERNHDGVMTASSPGHDKVMQDKIRLDKTRVKDTSISSTDVRSVFDHWVGVMGKAKNTRLTNDRSSKIKARLSEGFTVEDIKQAIDGCAMSDFHMGRNEGGKRYDGLSLICRNAEKLEFFMGGKEKTNDLEGWVSQ